MSAWRPLLTGVRVRRVAQVKLSLVYQIARTGIVAISLVEGRNLLNMEMIGKQDPYVKVGLGDQTRRGKTVHKGGRNPYFAEEEVAFWLDKRHAAAAAALV